MQFDLVSLDNAIRYILDDKIGDNRPVSLRMVAEKHFIEHYDREIKEQQLIEAYYICHQASLDLFKNGQITYGAKNWSPNNNN